MDGTHAVWGRAGHSGSQDSSTPCTPHPTHSCFCFFAMSVGAVAQQQVVLVRLSIIYLSLFQRFIDAGGWGVLLGSTCISYGVQKMCRPRGRCDDVSSLVGRTYVVPKCTLQQACGWIPMLHFTCVHKRRVSALTSDVRRAAFEMRTRAIDECMVS